MPARSIEHHRRMLVRGERLREAVQEHLHRSGIRIGQHQREGVIRAGFDGGKDIGKGEALVAEPRRALPALPPDMADAAFLPDARFVLKKQPNTLIFVRMLNVSEKRWSPF
jgi:hypothetical protein